MLKTTRLKDTLKFQVVVFILVRIVLNTTVRMVYPFLPVFGRGLGVDLGTLSQAIMLRSASGIFGPFLATIADIKGRKTGMMLGIALFTVGMGSMLIWPSYITFVIALVLSMLGIFAFLPSMQAYLGDKVQYSRRGFVLALTEFSWSLAFIIGIPIIGVLIVRFGWQAVFPLFTITGGLALGIIAWMLPSEESAGDGDVKVWKNLSKVYTFTPALAGIMISISLFAGNELINLIFGTWLENSFGVQIATLAVTAIVIGSSELGGEVLVMGITDRIGKRCAVALGIILNSLAVVLLPIVGRSLTGALIGLFFFYLTFEYTIVSSIPLMTEILPAARATMMAGFISAMSIGRAVGDFLAPLLYELSASIPVMSDIFFVICGVLFFNVLAGFALVILNSKLGNELG